MTELFLDVADRAVAAGWLILAVLLRDNIYQSEYVTSPFVLGLIRPKIYLPFSLGADTMDHVLAHEQAHIARRDHWWKPLGFALTAVYWFQPLMWVAYLLFCRDIELACDQRVVRTMDPMGRANYSQALLDCSTGRRPPGACPAWPCCGTGSRWARCCCTAWEPPTSPPWRRWTPPPMPCPCRSSRRWPSPTTPDMRITMW